MKSKTIFSAGLLVCAVALSASVAFAATTPVSRKPANSAPVKYTAEQRTCIKPAQDARMAAAKVAQDALNLATKDALAIKQSAAKVAQDALISATKIATAKRQAALKAAQAIKDPKARAAAIKSANDSYNNDVSVKVAKVPYMKAMEAANAVYDKNEVVKQAKIPYSAAIKEANDKYQTSLKACLSGSTIGFKYSINDMLQNVTASISGSILGLLKVFSFK